MHVLVIEDEERLAQNLSKAIAKNAGFAVDIALNGIDGLHLAVSGTFDAIILDLMLPGKSGQEVLAGLRKTGDKTPVLILTAKEEKSSIVELLNNGADDYLSKPFDLGELLARLKALIRRGKGQASPQLVVGDLTLDFESFSKEGFLLGHASVVCIPQNFSVAEYIQHLFAFTKAESCGKCFPCRLGSTRGAEMFDHALSGKRQLNRTLLNDLLDTMQQGSLCALGGGLPLPIKNALQYFESELAPLFDHEKLDNQIASSR